MKNKNIFSLLFASLGVLTFTACEDYFDDVPENADSLESVFSNRGQTLDWLTNVYGYIPDNTNRYASGTAMFWGPGTIEGYLPWDWVETHDIIHGTINTSTDFVERIWENYYKGIQYANIYLANVDKCDPLPQREKDWSRAECRALRAFFYFNLMKEYGPVPIVGDVVYSVDQSLSDMTLPRSTVDQCFDYILSELDDVISSGHLVSQFNEGSYDARMKGNFTLEAVQALRAEVLLFRASYIFNGDPYYMKMHNADGTTLFPQTRDDQKWRDAQKAAKDIIDSGKFRLVLRDSEGKLVTTSVRDACPYKSVFYASLARSDNEEMIYGRTSSANETYSMVPRFGNLSASYDKGGGAYSIPLQFVDLYFTNKGLRIEDDPSYYTYDTDNPPTGGRGASALVDNKNYVDPISGYEYFKKPATDPSYGDNPITIMKQFYNREARFYLAVTFQNRGWEFDKNMQVQMNFNGNSGSNGTTHDFPIFGTICRKLYYSKESNWDMAMMMRLGEVYLNYAEASAELGETEEALTYVNYIRSRAGIAEYKVNAADNTLDARGNERIALPSYDKDQVLKAVYRERILELAYESKHYFDVRRWGVAEGKWRTDGPEMTDGWVYPAYHHGGEGGEMLGFNVKNVGQTNENKNVNFYKRIVQDTRIYSKRMGLFPIPQDEINRNKTLVQNAGWEVEKNGDAE